MMGPAAGPARFSSHTIATELKGGYQVAAVDLNRDGRLDLIAVEQGNSELAWYENPGWERHVIRRGLSRMVNLGAWDTDGDRIPELVLAWEFAMHARKSVGIVSVLSHEGDPRQPWSIREIDRLPTSHRIRWAGIDGTGRKVAVNAPLTNASAEPPEFRGRTPLVFYRPPEWKRELIGDENEGVMHGIYVYDWDGDRRDDILTASFLGLHLYSPGKDGRWTRTQIAAGSPLPWPKSGSSDVAVGRLGKTRFLAAIEPWHGNQIVIYTPEGGGWLRNPIEESFVDGHTVVTGDLNGDRRDEVVAGFRGKGRSVYVYEAADGKGRRWTRTPLDEGGMGAAACVIDDLNGDGQPDVACIDASGLKWYENVRGTRGAPGR